MSGICVPVRAHDMFYILQRILTSQIIRAQSRHKELDQITGAWFRLHSTFSSRSLRCEHCCWLSMHTARNSQWAPCELGIKLPVCAAWSMIRINKLPSSICLSLFVRSSRCTTFCYQFDLISARERREHKSTSETPAFPTRKLRNCFFSLSVTKSLCDCFEMRTKSRVKKNYTEKWKATKLNDLSIKQLFTARAKKSQVKPVNVAECFASTGRKKFAVATGNSLGALDF